MIHLDPDMRARVRRALAGDSTDDQRDALAELARAHGIHWYDPETREEMEAAFPLQGSPMHVLASSPSS